MKSALKAVLPAPVLSQLRQWKSADGWRRLHRDWDRASAEIPRRDVPTTPQRLLIIPADPGGIIGSVGDEAMITATVEHFRTANPNVQISMLCMQGEAEQMVRSKGFTPIVIPHFVRFPSAMARLLQKGDYDALVILGADVMDGYYSAEYSTKLLVAADLAARTGMRTLFLGFSFNERAAPELAACFARLDPSVTLNLRDPSSLERILRFAPLRAQLVADAAFTLLPGKVDEQTLRWIDNEKASGRLVIGMNLHPMLIRHADTRQIASMVDRMVAAMRAASAQAEVSWMLVPHDYRDSSGDGDGICLRPLLDQLETTPGIRCRYFSGVHPAATLKALAGTLDGVVTGRMHLAIASLGMGTPVLCLTYQGKFEGLYRHFDLPSEFLLTPAVFEAEGALDLALQRFLSALPELRETVAECRGRVAELAARNFVPVQQEPA